MTFRLSPEALRAGHRLVCFDTIGSTNVEAMERARAGEAGPLWLVARRQTDGRGRRGSAWHSPDGNLAATLLLTTDLPPATIAQLGFVAGVALVRALDVCCVNRVRSSPPPRGEGLGVGGVGQREPYPERPPPRSPLGRLDPPREGEGGALGPTFSLKWPNDVLVGDAKLAGILLGAEEVAAGRRAVAVGMGVNVAASPDGLPYPTTSLGALGFDLSAEQLFGALSSAWVAAEALWDRGGRFDAVRALWLARAAGLGQPVAVRTGTAALAGSFETIDERGQLVLRDEQGCAAHVSAGEVYFGIAASAAMEAVA